MLALLVIILVVVIIRMRSKLAESKVKLSDIRLGDENQATSVYVHDNSTVGTSPSDVPVGSSWYGRSAPTGEHDYQTEQGLSGNNDQQTNTYERLDVDVTAQRGTYEKLTV
ncbi:uncharacterized protein LOC121385769 [Gigantopelta aegis]|uniref:uncharacterized protein LOC121385769 n=1 Tax=Gigantopelta aegis TaxID=1735272 RepID=UPI001B889394|nr:uncharacterized protein LOC121385769 [Gigantopelta aegis]